MTSRLLCTLNLLGVLGYVSRIGSHSLPDSGVMHTAIWLLQRVL